MICISARFFLAKMSKIGLNGVFSLHKTMLMIVFEVCSKLCKKSSKEHYKETCSEMHNRINFTRKETQPSRSLATERVYLFSFSGIEFDLSASKDVLKV